MLRLVRQILVAVLLPGAILLACSPLRAESLEQLLDIYMKCGLPLPPDDPQLVAVPSGTVSMHKDGTETPHVHLAFLLKPATDESSAVLLVGTEEYAVPSGVSFEALDVTDAELSRYHVEWHNPVFEVNTGLATALQFKSLGWDDAAEKLWKHSHAKGAGHHRSPFRLHDNTPAKAALIQTAWTHYANKLLVAQSDRKAIYDKMSFLRENYDAVRGPHNRRLLEDLELALEPSSAKEGSPEWYVDQLTELSSPASIMSHGSSDANYTRLVEMGFDAVPALIDHLDDSRLTRSYMGGFNNFPTYHRRVGEICTDILRGLVNEELGQGWLDRQRGITARKAEVREWFEEAQRVGERQYLLDNVLIEGGLRTTMLRVLAAKYPDTIPELYRDSLEPGSDSGSSELAKYIAASRLSRKKKLALLTAGATHASLDHRRAALWALKDLDGALFLEYLVETLDNLPRTTNDKYWSCVESSFAHLVVQTDASSAWTSLRKAAKRSDVGLRMELMNPMNYSYIGTRHVKQRLEFLSSFLNDTSIRDVADAEAKYDGPVAGFRFDRISVRDFAALKIASIVGVSERPDPKWTDDQWRQFREKTKAALSSYKTPKP